MVEVLINQEKKQYGIGLYLCKKLCDKLGLKIELNSESGKGTEVKIIFPTYNLYKLLLQNKKK